MTINCRGTLLDLSTPIVMGILNITPDSFFEGSRMKTEHEVRGQVEQMLEEGARIIDIGGVSSRPGADFVPVKEELNRVIPIIDLLVKHYPEALLSIDTYRAEVAKESIQSGIHLINDISASSIDDALLDVVAKNEVPYVLMHMQGTPETMQQKPHYKSVVVDVLDFLIEKIALLKKKGIEDIIIDPGFGFGKTIAHNYQLLNHLAVYKTLQMPILAGISRKSMIWKVLGNTPEKALNGTTALHVIALQNGASILRVHDVKPAMEAIQLMEILDKHQ
ncbi:MULTISPECIES: dihydropteroate synthase [unclassified Aureispira]|uniref:dihydropteroate synthase n=1 Tax=unclassified Aureispira TaxID=2649989 RepID=UPI0006977D62|nr:MULTISPECIES: dihydropteroate synthase [unclassified Aureispira]WMX16488.1 dihydropteroate synthase [Aureispira sp. CCB-E]